MSFTLKSSARVDNSCWHQSSNLSAVVFLSKLGFLGNHSSILGAYLCLEDKDEGSKSVSELEHDAKV